MKWKIPDKIPVPHPPFNRVRVLFVWFMVFLAMMIYDAEQKSQ